MRLSGLAVLTGVVLSVPVHAATIERVPSDGLTVVLSLTADEARHVRAGDRLTLTPRGADAPVSGRVVSVRGREVELAVGGAGDWLEEGRHVSVAALGDAPLAVAAKTSSRDEGPAPDRPRPGFETTLFHPSVVSPAQDDQINGVRSDVRVGFGTERQVMTAKTESGDLTTRGTELDALVGASLPRAGVRFGIDAVHREPTLDAHLSGTQHLSMSSQTTETDVAPFLAVDVGSHVVAGFQYDVIQKHEGSDFFGQTHEFSYAQPIPGVSYVDRTLEAGVVYRPRINQVSRATSTVGETGTFTTTAYDQQPAHYTAHGRMKLGGAGDDLFAVVTYNQNRMLNTDGTSGWKDNADLVLGGDKGLATGLGEAVLTAALVGNTQAYASPSARTSDNIVTYGGQLGFEQHVGKTAAVGAQVLYRTGRDKAPLEDGTTMACRHETVAVGMTGSYKL